MNHPHPSAPPAGPPDPSLPGRSLAGGADGPTDSGGLQFPKPFEHDGVRWYPAAVAMYGDMTDIVPFSATVDADDGGVWGDHVVLFRGEAIFRG